MMRTSKYLLCICVAIAIYITPSDASPCKWENTTQKGCICERLWVGNITAKCRVSNTSTLTSFISQPEAVLSLDLSKSNLKEFTSNSMDIFINLFVMNLSGNSLLNLNTLSTNRFPRLAILDVSGLPDWISINHVKQSMRMLQVIRGTPLDKKCLRCFLKKPSKKTGNGYGNNISYFMPETSKAVTRLSSRSGACYGRVVYFTHRYFREMQKIGFTMSCLMQNWCTFLERAQTTRVFRDNEKMVKVVSTNRCWRKMNDFSVGVILLSPIAIVLNSLVVIVTMFCKQLQEKTSTFLISIIAVGDLLAGLYLFIIHSTKSLVSYKQMVDLVTSTMYCTLFGTLFLMSQGLTVFTAFFMTLERYLSIVYCLNPDVRLHIHIAKKCVVFIFAISFAMGVLPYTALSKYYINSSHCMPNATHRDLIEYLAILGSISSILYLTAIPLYFRMYLSIRRSSQDLAIQRERKVQKKILLIVVTNIIFFALPFVCFGIIHSTPLRRLIPAESIQIFFKTFMYYCYAASSCLNPLLFSFRNDKFIQGLKRLLRIPPSKQINPMPLQQPHKNTRTSTPNSQTESKE